MSYAYITEMDGRIVKARDGLPAYFDPETISTARTNEPQLMESILIHLIAETRLLRLHRPFLSRGYKMDKYACHFAISYTDADFH